MINLWMSWMSILDKKKQKRNLPEKRKKNNNQRIPNIKMSTKGGSVSHLACQKGSLPLAPRQLRHWLYRPIEKQILPTFPRPLPKIIQRIIKNVRQFWNSFHYCFLFCDHSHCFTSYDFLKVNTALTQSNLIYFINFIRGPVSILSVNWTAEIAK